MASAVSHQHGKITDAQLMAQLDEQRTKLEFELHLSHITEMHKAFFDNMSKVSGFLLLALGWFATSKDARAYLASEPTLSTLAAIGVLAAYLLSVAAAVVAYRASRLALQRLNELNFGLCVDGLQDWLNILRQSPIASAVFCRAGQNQRVLSAS